MNVAVQKIRNVVIDLRVLGPAGHFLFSSVEVQSSYSMVMGDNWMCTKLNRKVSMLFVLYFAPYKISNAYD